MTNEPIFVDSTGTRRRWLKVFGAAGGIALVVAAAMLLAGFLGGGPGHLPGLPALPAPATRAPAATPPPPRTTATPSPSPHSASVEPSATPTTTGVPTPTPSPTGPPGHRNSAHPTPSHKK